MIHFDFEITIMFYCQNMQIKNNIMLVTLLYIKSFFCKLTFTPNDIYTSCGEEVIIPCVTDLTNALMFWQLTKLDKKVVSIYKGNLVSDRTYYEIIGDKDTNYTLHIKKVDENVMGTYTCTDNGGIGESANAEVICPTTTAYPGNSTNINSCEWYHASMAISSTALAFVVVFFICVVKKNLQKTKTNDESTFITFFPFFIILGLYAMLIIGSAIILKVDVKNSFNIGILVINASGLFITFVLIVLYCCKDRDIKKGNRYLISLLISSSLIFPATFIWTCVFYNKATTCKEWSWQIFLITFCVAFILFLLIYIIYLKSCSKGKLCSCYVVEMNPKGPDIDLRKPTAARPMLAD